MNIKTDIPNLDIILSGKGLPLGKLYEIYGEESTSKSTLAQFFSKKFQQQFEDGKVLYIDSENTFDLARYVYMGGNADTIEVFKSIVVEDIFKKIEDELSLAEVNNYPLFIIIDTIASTITKAESDKGGYAGGISEKPRFLSRVMPKIVDMLAKTNSTLVIVNQVYDNIGSVGKKSKGGRSIKYYASIRMEVQRIKDIERKMGDLSITEGIVVKLITRKNKLFYPRLETYLYIHNEEGVKEEDSLIYFLESAKIITKTGAWKRFNYGDIDFKFNNAESFKINLDKYPGARDLINYLIYDKYIHISPLVKAKLIKSFNELEERLGKELTELTDRERYLAELEERNLQEV